MNNIVSGLTFLSAVLSIPVLLAFLARQWSVYRVDPVLFRTRIALSAWLLWALAQTAVQARAQWIAYHTGDVPFEPWLSLATSVLRLVAVGLTAWAFQTWWRKKV